MDAPLGEAREQQPVDFIYVEKRVILERADSGFFINIAVPFKYNAISREIHFSEALNRLFEQGNNTSTLRQQYQSKNVDFSEIESCQIFYYDSVSKFFIYTGCYPFTKELLLKCEDLQDDELYIKYKVLQTYPPDGYVCPEPYELPVVADPVPTTANKKRVKERSIKEVLRSVSEWRRISQIQKCTLEVAAKYVGLSKKTLDDYYMRIKLGEKHGFDFQAHLENGVGELRKFLKDKHEKKKPEEVKILQRYQNEGDWYFRQDSNDQEEE